MSTTQRTNLEIPHFQRMQFLGSKRTISEEVLTSLASHQHRYPNIVTSYNSRSHAKWHNLIPIRGHKNSKDGPSSQHNELQGALTLCKKAARRCKFLEPLRSTSRLNSGSQALLGEKHSPSSYGNGTLGFRAIAAKKSRDSLKDTNLRGKLRKGRYQSTHQKGEPRSTKIEREAVEDGDQNEDREYDAVLVLAGGQVAGGGVPVWVERRLEKALELQQSSRKNGALCKIVCLGGGTPHRAPIFSSGGFVVHESTSCAEFLHRLGADFAHVIKEWASYDTIGNGYFSLTQHVIPRKWRVLAVVTSEFHMPRTRAVFEWIFGLDGAGFALQHEQGHGQKRLGVDDGPIMGTGSRAQGFCLEFHSVPDHGDIDESVVQARLEREWNSIKNLKILSQRIRTLEDFHEWFHTGHKAYNTEDQHVFGDEDKDDPALQSY